MACPSAVAVRLNFFLLLLLWFEAVELLRQVVHYTREDAVGDSLRVSHIVLGFGAGEAQTR